MHLIWKRPDGFHGASPMDFLVVELEGHSRLWLHKSDKDQYPFAVSGGWDEREATVRLNNLVNLLPEAKPAWVSYLVATYNHSMKSEPKEFFKELFDWITELEKNVKGDTWEVDILRQALKVTRDRLGEVKDDFIKKAG